MKTNKEKGQRGDREREGGRADMGLLPTSMLI